MISKDHFNCELIWQTLVITFTCVTPGDTRRSSPVWHCWKLNIKFWLRDFLFIIHLCIACCFLWRQLLIFFFNKGFRLINCWITLLLQYVGLNKLSFIFLFRSLDPVYLFLGLCWGRALSLHCRRVSNATFLTNWLPFKWSTLLVFTEAAICKL